MKFIRDFILIIQKSLTLSRSSESYDLRLIFLINHCFLSSLRLILLSDSRYTDCAVVSILLNSCLILASSLKLLVLRTFITLLFMSYYIKKFFSSLKKHHDLVVKILSYSEIMHSCKEYVTCLMIYHVKSESFKCAEYLSHIF